MIDGLILAWKDGWLFLELEVNLDVVEPFSGGTEA